MTPSEIPIDTFPRGSDKTVIALGDGIRVDLHYDPVTRQYRMVPEFPPGSEAAIQFAHIRENDSDRTAQLVFADWCDEHEQSELATRLRGAGWDERAISRRCFFPAVVRLWSSGLYGPFVACLPQKYIHSPFRGTCLRVRRNGNRLDVRPQTLTELSPLPSAFDVAATVRLAYSVSTVEERRKLRATIASKIVELAEGGAA